MTVHDVNVLLFTIYLMNKKDEWKDVLRPFQHIVRLYRDRNLQRDKMKDDSPIRYTMYTSRMWTHTIQ